MLPGYRAPRKFLFLSTLSLRRATRQTPGEMVCGQNFYPRSPCGERPAEIAQAAARLAISIHALLAESDGYQAGP